jgi:O-antigen/teichoic acid export membrane protein
MSSIIQRFLHFPLLAKLGIERKFLQRSFINYIGISLGRVLGLAFSLVLARAYSTSDYGYASYALSLGSLLAVVTQPFGQHVISYLIGKYRDDPDELAKMVSNAWAIWSVLFMLTLVVGIPILLGLDRLTGEVLAVFVGLTCFYTYQGIATGFLSSSRVLVLYLGSNALQIVLVLIFAYVLRLPSVIPSIYVYGLVYFVPLVILMIWFPLPIRFRPSWDIQRVRSIIKFTLPIFISHILYIIYYSTDIMLLEIFTDRTTIGIYSLTKTLRTAFYLIPQSISMILMPSIAGATKAEGRRQFWSAFSLSLGLNVLLLVVFLIFYQPFVVGVFGEEYFIGLPFALIMALAGMMFAARSVIFAVLVGTNRTSLDNLSRLVVMVTIVVIGVVLIPSQGAMGAAWAMFVSNALGFIPYGIFLLRRKAKRKAKTDDLAVEVEPPPAP